MSNVKDDYRGFRNFDVERQASRYVSKGIVISVVIVITALLALSQYVNMLALLYIELLLGFVIVGPIIFYFLGRMKTKMNMAMQGYDVVWNGERQRWFGTDTYKILRADPGGFQGAVVGMNMNPFTVSTPQLQDIEKEQREDAQCDVCGQELFESRLEDGGGYFVEERTRLWFLGVPIAERIRKWDTYCSDHKPAEYQ